MEQSQRLARFWGRLASIYDENELLAGGTYPPIAQKLRGEFGAADRVLDAGAGTGKLSAHVVPLVAHVTCTDIAPEMLEQARARLAPFDHVVFRVEDVTALSFEANTFDAVLCCNVLHQIPNPDTAIQEFRRVLRPGGKLVAITLAMGDMPLWQRLRLGAEFVLRFGVPPGGHSFRLDTLARLVADAAFDVVEATWVTRKPFPTAYVSGVLPA